LFNPLFFNDNPFKEAPLVKRMMHFANKYRSAGIINATAKHLLSHLEYGGCLADFPGLNSRYRRIRGLEDVDELRQINGPADEARVRFVNYYTLSSGRKKPPKPSSSANPTPDLTPFPSQSADGTSLMTRETTMDTGTSMSSFSTGPSPSIAVQDKGSDHIDTSSDPPPSYKENSEVLPTADESQHDKQDAESIRSGVDHFSMLELDPCPLPDDDQSYAMDQGNSMDESSITDQTLPPIPDLPTRPTTPDFEQYTDKDARKQAEKEFRRVQKSHERAVKDRNKAVREREKAVEKRRREAQKEAEKLLREEAKFFQRQQQQAKKLQKEEEKAIQRLQQQEEDTSRQDTASASIDRREPITDSLATQTATSGGDKTPPEGKKKNKKFCTLPPKRNGVADSTWVDVYMDGMDEVSAHCGLFFPGPHYDRLIGDVGMRIVGWVQDDLTRRAILEMEQLSVD
jgi:chemotaxis protein histidine kinase CheA